MSQQPWEVATHYPHFTEVSTEAERGYINLPKVTKLVTEEPNFRTQALNREATLSFLSCKTGLIVPAIPVIRTTRQVETEVQRR